MFSTGLLIAESDFIQRNFSSWKYSDKRKYLSDYHLFISIFTVKNVTFQVAKAGIIPIIGFTQKLEAFNKQKDDARREGFEIEEDFDFNAEFQKQLPVFQSWVMRNCMTSIIRKGFDLACLLNCNVRLTDRLCKDISKSAIRKIQRFGRFGAGTRMLKTALYAGCLGYSSSFTYDVLARGYEVIFSKTCRASVFQHVAWLGKKALFYSLLLVASAGGFSLGTMFDSKNAFGFSLSLIFELAAGEIGTRLLGL